MIARKNTHSVNIAGIHVGGDNPIVVQSMTNTDTADVAGTVRQVKELADAGSELVRIKFEQPWMQRATPRLSLVTFILMDINY